jgi:alpha-L-rhamnosidase
LFLACLLSSAGQAGATPAAAGDLRCEYLRDPLGLDESRPRLSWVLPPSGRRRGERQTAYRVLVASSPGLLARDRGDLWDSGRVTSDETAHVEYAGMPLASRQACWWKVRTWDERGEQGAWSRPARWARGLLTPADWSATWVSAERRPPESAGELTVVRASYETAEGEPRVARDVTGLLRGKLTGGRLEFRADNDALGGDPAYGRVKQLRVAYRLGGKDGELVVREGQTLSLPDAPLPYLRRSFTLAAKTVRRARLYVTALGLYEVRLNGARVGDHLLAPEWTDYAKRVRYQSYDVTRMLRRGGPNTLAALVGDGWYSGHIGNGGYRHWGTVPALLAQLEIEYADGTAERVVTDENWKTRPGPVLSSDFMLGEEYDARREVKGWDRPGLDERGWAPAAVRDEAPRPLDGQSNEPVRQTGTLTPRSVKEAAPGRWVFDLGQNMVGVVRLRVKAPAGTRVTLRHAEMLNPDGTPYTANLRGAPSVDVYTCRGGGRRGEVWQPRFTFHGFRYVEVSGLPAGTKPSKNDVTGVVIGSDTPEAGTFACSDPRLNRLQENIEWGQRGNFLSVPTDCPQRDERLGWTGDAEVFVRTATHNADVAAFFTKWLVDLDDAQLPDGRFTDVAPHTMGDNFTGAPAWGDAGVICPWTVYLAYGDRRLLERHLPAMERWVEWCRAHSTGLIRDRDRGNDYGDWLSIGADTPKDVIATAFFAHSTDLLARAERAVGRTEQAERYEGLFNDIRDAFGRAYVAPDGRIKGDTQCVYALALRFDLLPEPLHPTAARHLEDDVRAKGWHLSTGFVGVSHLLPVLAEAGKSDTAYRLLTQDTFPSWLFSVKHGATTIWERWDGWTPDKGFQNPGMNSFNHYSLGSCGEWLYEGVAGIAPDPEAPGYRHVVVRPRVVPDGGLTWAKASYRSLRGTIKSGWSLKGGLLTLDVTVPPNVTATVYVPTADPAAVRESGRPADAAEGVTLLRTEEDAAVFRVGSGTYSFTAPFAPAPARLARRGGATAARAQLLR